jgi:hypothetical protein
MRAAKSSPKLWSPRCPLPLVEICRARTLNLGDAADRVRGDWVLRAQEQPVGQVHGPNAAAAMPAA